MGRVFTNGLGDLGSIPSRVIPKTQKKWYLMPPCLTLSIIRWGSREKWSNSGKGVAPSPTTRCSSYWKGSLQVTLDKGRQLYLLLTLLERRMRGNLIETFKIINRISNWGSQFFSIFLLKQEIYYQISKTKSTNQMDMFY